jgi:hypothetical protein
MLRYLTAGLSSDGKMPAGAVKDYRLKAGRFLLD